MFIPAGASQEDGVVLEDPAWTLALNGVSLVLALTANLALLLNMSMRLKFMIAQPISIIGFFLASVFLIIDLAVEVSSPNFHLSPDSPAFPAASHALSSAFYFAIEAAVIYMIISILLCLTLLGTFLGHYKAEFRLTIAQRTLMLQTMAFVTYLLLGALVFSHVEGWLFLDGVYWADITLLTIGLGSDYHPSTHTGRTLLFFFAIGGIIIIGLVIGSIRTLVLERGKAKMSARMIEKHRLRAVNSVDPAKHRIRISALQTMEFDNSELNKSKRRHLEFNVMRRVQAVSYTHLTLPTKRIV